MRRGFLPTQDPLQELPKDYEAWEELAHNFTSYINAGIIRERIDALPVIENPEFDFIGAYERAMMLLSFFAHAYVYTPPNPKKYIPASIAIPWVSVAQDLKRKPVLSHPSIVLNNWRKLDSQKPIQLDNLATQIQFHGGIDESWFYLVTVDVERVGAEAIPLVLEAMNRVEEGEFSIAAESLERAIPILKNLTMVLKKMYAYCDPYIFYSRVRPFFASFENIEYKGANLALQNLHGGSAAQSSLLQFFDAAFGIEYKQKATKDYLQLMRLHMPFQHAEFLSFVENTSKIKDEIVQSKKLRQAYEECIQMLIEFRNEHLKIVALYIMKQAKLSQTQAKGTGGTNPMVFLKSVRNQNEALLGDKLKKEQ